MTCTCVIRLYILTIQAHIICMHCGVYVLWMYYIFCTMTENCYANALVCVDAKAQFSTFELD